MAASSPRLADGTTLAMLLRHPLSGASMPLPSDPLASLRGALPARAIGARGLEHLARNPGCERLLALSVLGVRASDAATALYNEPAEGQSPFALSVGERFEARLFEDGAARLLALYIGKGRLPEGATAVDVAARVPGTGEAARTRRSWLSLRLLRQHLAGDPAAPAVILHPRLSVDLAGVAVVVEPDGLVVSDGVFRVIEVKSYPDRAGKTDPSDLRGASRQAAVGLVALREALARLGATEVARRAPAWGDLVLRKPGTMEATLRPLTLEGELASLLSALDHAPAARARLEAGPPIRTAADLDAIRPDWRESCREHCGLNAVCKRQAEQAGALSLLGGAAREALAPAGDLHRALALLDGAAPSDAAEAMLAEQLRAAVDALEEATRHVA